MNREEALEKIAWHALKKLSRNEAEEIIRNFFKEPLKPELREKLNITTIIQWETHEPPRDLHPGNQIYRPVLIDRMADRFRGATNEYLADYLRQKLGLDIESVEGEFSEWLDCFVCEYKTFYERGNWQTCPVCGWVSDPMQEALPDEPIGSNGISLTQARENYAKMGYVSESKKDGLDKEGRQKYPKAN